MGSFYKKVDSSQPFFTKDAGDEINAFAPIVLDISGRGNQSFNDDKPMLLQDPERVQLLKENKHLKEEQAKLQSQAKFYKTKFQQIKSQYEALQKKTKQMPTNWASTQGTMHLATNHNQSKRSSSAKNLKSMNYVSPALKPQFDKERVGPKPNKNASNKSNKRKEG